MASVASQIKAGLIAAVNTIDGSGLFNYNLGGRCTGRRSKDGVELPNAGLFRGEDTRDSEEGHRLKVTRNITWILEGYVSADDDRDDDPAELLLEDFERAIEADETLGGLLQKRPQIVEAATEEPADGSTRARVLISIETTHPHKYGAPEHVYS